jgi:hypothetical protein
VNLYHAPAGTIRASRRRRLGYAQDDPDRTSAVTPSLLSNHSRTAARALESQPCAQTARAARRAQLPMPRWLAGGLALVTGCILGPFVGGAALGADWGTTLLTTLAVACAVASVAGRRLGCQRVPGADRIPVAGEYPAAENPTSRPEGSEMPIIAEADHVQP